MSEYAYVYILASGFKKLYIGITTELEVRIRRARGQAPWPHNVLGLGAHRDQSEIASQSPRYPECGGDLLPGDERVGDG